MKKNLFLIEGTLDSSHLETIKKADKNKSGIIVLRDLIGGDFNLLLAICQFLSSNTIPYGIILLGKVGIPSIAILLSHNIPIRYATKDVIISFDFDSYKNTYVSAKDVKEFETFFAERMNKRLNLSDAEFNALKSNSLNLNYEEAYVAGIVDRKLSLLNSNDIEFLNDVYLEERTKDITLYQERAKRIMAKL